MYVSEVNLNTVEINNVTFSMSVESENDTVELGGKNEGKIRFFIIVQKWI